MIMKYKLVSLNIDNNIKQYRENVAITRLISVTCEFVSKFK